MSKNPIPLKLRRELAKIDRQRTQEKINKEREAKGLKPIASTEDLRDDCVSLVKNSGISFEEIHNRNGPTPQTLARWRDKEVVSPNMNKMRSALRAIGKDIGIIDFK